MDADGPISISMPFQAILDPASGTNMRILRTAPAADVTAPALIGSLPAAGATDVSVDTAISLIFSEPVSAGTGNIIVSNGADDTRTVPVA